MATMCFAMWLQEPDLARTNHLIMVFIGLVAVAMAIMAIALIVLAVTTAKAIKAVVSTVEQVKDKTLPLIDAATEISKTSKELLQDVSPKVKVITDNLVKTSEVARSTVEKIDTTLTDANLRTQRQVARVDGMITAALTTTTEVVEAVANGIRVPVQKMAAMANQARQVAEGLFVRFRAKTAASRNPDQE